MVVWVLEDKDNTIWVNSTSGDDDNPGDRSLPLATILAALLMADDINDGADLYLADGDYGGLVELMEQASFYGGYDPETWIRNFDLKSTGTILKSGLYGRYERNLTLSGLVIEKLDSSYVGRNSVALLLPQ